jgi:transposase-like protein
MAITLLEEKANDRGDNEVLVPPKRRFTAQYKIKVLNEAEKLTPVERGAYLRKRGLYSSHLSRWRKQAAKGLLSALSKPPGRKSTKDPKDEQIAQLTKQNQKLQTKLKQAEIIIDIQKKVAELLGIQLPENTKPDN